MQDDLRETAARRAIDAGDWQTARDLFETLTRETNAPEAWAGLAEAAWLQQDSRLMIDARLTAYRLYRERGNDIAAAQREPRVEQPRDGGARQAEDAQWAGGDAWRFRPAGHDQGPVDAWRRRPVGCLSHGSATL